MRRTLGMALLLALAAAATAQQPTVRTVLSNGPSANRYDMVILGDGYSAAEQSRFDQDVSTFLTALFAKPPYSTFSSYFNVHTVFRASADSGASHPDATPPIIRSTAYGSSYNTGGTDRCLYVQDTTQALIDAAMAPANEARVMVLVNDPRYGGCAGQFAVSYNGPLMAEVQSHEIGHSLALLGDEYDYPYGHYQGLEPPHANVTMSPVGQKWSHWWGVDGVSAFAGAGYYQSGLYRPRHDCLMRSLGVPICPVCKEQTTRAINAVVDTIQAAQPSSPVTIHMPAVQTFSFTNIVPAQNNPLVLWYVDGVAVAGQNGSSFALDTATLTPGRHVVTVRVEDQTTMVRSDPLHQLVDIHSWVVTVVDPTATNLALLSGLTSTVQARPGSTVDVVVTVQNISPNAQQQVRLDHYLSFDTSIGASDLYLGGEVLSALLPGESRAVHFSTRIPNFVRSGTWRVLSVLDRDGQVVESNENDNQCEATVALGNGSCGETLEYRDPALYPRDHAEISILQGGDIQPTVTARCATAGSMYVIVWGSSGTSPGTPIGPGLVVPLNQDICTDLSLQLMNGLIFQQFFGVLDSDGIGRATFHWPANLPVTPDTTHFAGLVLDPVQARFTGVTNAVSLEMR
jgi:hypothetical protein